MEKGSRLQNAVMEAGCGISAVIKQGTSDHRRLCMQVLVTCAYNLLTPSGFAYMLADTTHGGANDCMILQHTVYKHS